MASKPVAKTTASNAYSASPTFSPFSVKASTGVWLTSTRWTFSRLKVS